MVCTWLSGLRRNLIHGYRRRQLTQPRPRAGGTPINLPAVPALVQVLEPRQFLSASGAGSEFRVNTFTTGSQQTFAEVPGSVAVDADGDYVVTWSSNGQDAPGDNGVYAQRYNAAGVAQGSEFRVNSTTAGGQRSSTVAMAC